MESKEEDGNVDTTALKNNLNEPVASYTAGTSTVAGNSHLQYEEILGYWSRLSHHKKEAVLQLMKAMVEDERPPLIPEKEWEMMQQQRADFLAGKAKTYTQQEAREILRNPEKRNALLNNG